ncbi:MAG: diguanylate cyclase [Usitatibacter sp.]
MLDDLLLLARPAGHSEILARRRAEVIRRRVRGIASLFAVLTLAWIPVDAAVFARSHWQDLAAARVAAAIALAALASACGAGPTSPGRVRALLLALYGIAAAFFVATLEIFIEVPREGVAAGVAAAYSFVPFVLAAGISAFPLTAGESLVLAAIAFLSEAWALNVRGHALLPYSELEGFWLLLLIAGVAAFAAMSQLRLLAALVQQAVRDPLTLCLRHESGKELLDAQFLLAVRHDAPLTVLFADIDHFKAANDEFGHEAGDKVLAQVAASLRAALRESDVLVRWGGEEFVLVLPQAESAEVDSLIDRLRARGFGRLPDGRAVTLSIGMAERRRDALGNCADLVTLADQRMYAAKQAGRNRFVASGDGAAPEILASAA